jgi:hypothetical protein
MKLKYFTTPLMIAVPLRYTDSSTFVRACNDSVLLDNTYSACRSLDSDLSSPLFPLKGDNLALPATPLIDWRHLLHHLRLFVTPNYFLASQYLNSLLLRYVS